GFLCQATALAALPAPYRAGNQGRARACADARVDQPAPAARRRRSRRGVHRPLLPPGGEPRGRVADCTERGHLWIRPDQRAGSTGAGLAAQMLEARAQVAPAGKAPASSAPLVAPDDPSIVAGIAEFPGEGVRLDGYLARPAGTGRHAIVLVCHENRGLTRHIEDVARRVAKAGYVGLAVDLLSREGGTAKHEFDAIPGVLGKAAPARHVQDFKSGLAYARSLPWARADRVGMIGFCFGGAVTWRVAAGVPDLRAAVPFYGVPVQEPDVPGIGAAVLAIYGGLD